MLHRSLTSRDHPPPPGVTLVEGGAQVCVYAGHADGVQVCLFEPGDVHGETERRGVPTPLLYGYWFGFVPGMGVGQRYGFRVSGPWAPHDGMQVRCTSVTLLSRSVTAAIMAGQVSV